MLPACRHKHIFTRKEWFSTDTVATLATIHFKRQLCEQEVTSIYGIATPAGLTRDHSTSSPGLPYMEIASDFRVAFAAAV